MCVCVCTSESKEFPFRAGGSGPLKSPLPTKLLLSWEDIQADHLDVPAKRLATRPSHKPGMSKVKVIVNRV